jgi:hypothetical protein
MVTYIIPPKHFLIGDADDLEQSALNAARSGKEEEWFKLMKIRCRVERRIARDPLEIEFRSIMKAYEMILSKKNRKKTPATYTWRAYHNRGLKKVLEKWSLENKEVHYGFQILVERKAYELTGEYLLLRAKNRFAPNVCKAARAKLIKAGAPKELLKKADENQLRDFQ